MSARALFLAGIGVAALGGISLATWIWLLRDAKVHAEASAHRAADAAQKHRGEALEREMALKKICAHFGMSTESTPAELARSLLFHTWSNPTGRRSKAGAGESPPSPPPEKDSTS